MSRMTFEHFVHLNIAILTVNNRRTLQDDTTGNLLNAKVSTVGHVVSERVVIPANKYQIRSVISDWVASDNIQVILISGGTGLTEDDITPEAIEVLFDKQVAGFGELFRQRSLQQIGYSTLQSRALAGLANKTLIVAMPGSPKACDIAWDEIISAQLDARQGPCNFVPQLKASDGVMCPSREKDACN